MHNPVNEALKQLEDRMDAVELRSKLLAGKTSEIAQILEVKTVEATKEIVDLAVDQKTKHIADVVEQKRIELADEVSHKIDDARGRSIHEIEALDKKSAKRSRRVFYIIVLIFTMMVGTALMGFNFVTQTEGLIGLSVAFSFLVALVVGL